MLRLYPYKKEGYHGLYPILPYAGLAVCILEIKSVSCYCLLFILLYKMERKRRMYLWTQTEVVHWKPISSGAAT